MSSKSIEKILVLGAYGLAGRAIVERLVTHTDYIVIAAGRNLNKLELLQERLENERVQVQFLDATDESSLKKACTEVSFVINAVGPFTLTGAMIARTVMECGCPYLDCANEQGHYQNLKGLADLSQGKSLPLITAAGVIPGLSTLFVAYLIKQFEKTSEVTCCWAQFRHAYAESGLASMMGGILEAMEQPLCLQQGELQPLLVGSSINDFEMQEPFGRLRFMELPAIDTLTLAEKFPLQELHTWFYLGDMPTWLLGLLRLLRPDRRPWAYHLVKAIMQRMNDKETAKAIADGVGPECLLEVTAVAAGNNETRFMMFRDGASATACLPVYIVKQYMEGKLEKAGLCTPLDIINPEAVFEIAGDTLIKSDLQQG